MLTRHYRMDSPPGQLESEAPLVGRSLRITMAYFACGTVSPMN